MAIYAGLTKAYAQAIYLDGTKKFSDIKTEYVEPVKQYAAATYTKAQIDAAHMVKGYISLDEYNDTMAYKYPDGNIPLEIEPTTEQI